MRIPLKIAILIALIFLSAPCFAARLIYENVEDQSVTDSFDGTFGRHQFTTVVNTYNHTPEGEYSLRMERLGSNAHGTEKFDLPQAAQDGDEYYIKYYVYYPPSWDWESTSDTAMKQFRGRVTTNNGDPIAVLSTHGNLNCDPGYLIAAIGLAYGTWASGSCRPTLATETWHEVIIYIRYASSGGVHRMTINGDVWANATGNTALWLEGHPTWFEMLGGNGCCSNGPGNTLFYVDDIEIWDEIPPEGPIAINPTVSTVDPHYNSSGKRSVRIGNTRLALAHTSTSNEAIYRSTDGVNWSMLRSFTIVHSGSLITGPDNYVYYFYYNSDNIYMSKFLYDGSPPAGTSIASDPGLSNAYDDQGNGTYYSVNATVDEDGHLYVAYPGDNALFVSHSDDGGSSWDAKVNVASGLATRIWYYPWMVVTWNNSLVIVFNEFGVGSAPNYKYSAYSTDRGQNWTRNQIGGTEFVQNICLLATGDNEVYLMGQSIGGPGTGLVWNHTDNRGASWDGWSLVDGTCGYADPGAALAANGDIWVAYRDKDVDGGTCGNQSREKVIIYDGASWSTHDFYTDALGYERTGTRSAMRYQTFHSYGGDMEWVWMQYINSGSNRPIYYDADSTQIYQYAAVSTTYGSSSVSGFGGFGGF